MGMSEYYVYLLLDPTDFYKPFYVGKGKGDRMLVHLTEQRNDNRFKANKIAKIRRMGGEPVAMKWATGLQETAAYELEAQLIKRFGRRSHDAEGILTNICEDNRPPDPTGREVSDETKEKIASKQRGENNHRFGKTFTPDQREKRSEIAKARGMKPPVRTGPMSEEQKKKISEANRGRKWSDEARARASEARKGKKRGPPSPETIEKIRQSNIGKIKRKWTEDEKIEHRRAQKERWSKKTEAERAVHGERIRQGKKKKRRSAK